MWFCTARAPNRIRIHGTRVETVVGSHADCQEVAMRVIGLHSWHCLNISLVSLMRGRTAQYAGTMIQGCMCICCMCICCGAALHCTHPACSSEACQHHQGTAYPNPRRRAVPCPAVLCTMARPPAPCHAVSCRPVHYGATPGAVPCRVLPSCALWRDCCGRVPYCAL